MASGSVSRYATILANLFYSLRRLITSLDEFQDRLLQLLSRSCMMRTEGEWLSELTTKFAVTQEPESRGPSFLTTLEQRSILNES